MKMRKFYLKSNKQLLVNVEQLQLFSNFMNKTTKIKADLLSYLNLIMRLR